MDAFLCVGGKQHHDQLGKGWLFIRVAEHEGTLLPERLQQVVFLKLRQQGIFFQFPVCQHAAQHFLETRQLASAQHAHQTDLDGGPVIAADLQVIEGLGTLLLSEEFDIPFDDRLAARIHTQIQHEQAGPVGKEFFGIMDRVCQMVLPDIRLGEGGIDQVVRRPVFPLQKELCPELVILLQMIHLRIFQLQRIHVLGKLALRVIPEDELPDIPRKLRIQLIRDLFEIHFRHSKYPQNSALTIHCPFF